MDHLLVSPRLVSSHSKTRSPGPDVKSPCVKTAQATLSPVEQSATISPVATLAKRLRTVNDLLLSCRDGLSADQRQQLKLRNERRALLCQRIKTADSYKSWHAAAQELDALDGNDAWKIDPASDDYNPDLIQQRLTALDDARSRSDTRSMMHLVRTSLSRDLAGMGNVDLYRNSYVGTKDLIERYVDSAIQTIDALVALDRGLDSRDLLDGMLYSRQSFGRSALLLSGGGTFGMAHVGVLKALFEARLLPRIISGSSAGSIVCAVVCTRTDAEIPAVIRDFPHGDLAVFDAADSSLGFLDHLRRLLTEGSWSDIDNLIRVMRGLAGDLTFQEAYNRTRRVLNICVSPASIYELPRLLNYVTAPNVLIWSAVAASCSVPLFFSSSPLFVKDPATGDHHPWNPSPQRFIDGSVDNDLPMTRLAEMFNVNHFIVSQVNPHVIPFLPRDDYLGTDAEPARSRRRRRGLRRTGDGGGGGDGGSGGSSSGGGGVVQLDWTSTLVSLAKDEAVHRLQFMADVGVLPNLMTKCRSVLSQKYSGDITILPEMTMQDLPRLMRNPTCEFVQRSSVLGERATWPKLSRIRDRCAIELALDAAVHRLRARVVFSQSQRDLRGLGSAAMSRIGEQQQQQQQQSQPQLQQQSLPLPPSPPPPPGSAMAGFPSSLVNCSSPVPLATGRQRRRSGGSAPMPLLMGQAGVTDDKTAEEERSEMVSRRRRTQSPLTTRHPGLKRAARSHVHMPLDQISRPASVPEGDLGRPLNNFDFSRPLPLALQPSSGPGLEGSDEFGRPLWAQHADSPRGTATSPTDDMDTSEQDQSSDDDDDNDDTAEQDTAESDTELFDNQTRPTRDGSTRRLVDSNSKTKA